MGVRVKLLAVALILVAGGRVRAASVIHVPADQPTIQAAINVAANGDSVLVAPGTYVENINFLGKAIRVESEQGAQFTVIDGNSAGSVVTFASGEGPQSVITGFTIRNGKGDVHGGGVRISNASPSVIGNIVTANVAGTGGGGIASNFGSPLIQSNMITGNGQITGYSGGTGGGGVLIGGASAARLLNNVISGNSWSSASGGGVSLFAAGTPLLRDNFITNNVAASQGGGISIFNHSDASILQNVIAGNSAGQGGGVFWLVPSGARGPSVVNNTITGNNSAQGSAVFADGFDGQTEIVNNIIAAPAGNAVHCGVFDANAPQFLFNDVFAAAGLAYSGSCASQTGLNGNISADPLFRDPAAGDYHLQVNSPAIDAAQSTVAPNADLDGNPRPTDGNSDGIADADMGAYESPALDTTPPVTTATVNPAPNAAGWNNTNTSVTLISTDAGSGVQALRYSLSGAQNQPLTVTGGSAVITVTAEGVTTVSFSAVDNANNTEAGKTSDVRIDKTGPSITGMPAEGCQLSPPKHQMVQVASITAQDGLSGVASLSVTATSSEPDSGVGGGDVPGDIVINGGVVQLRAERAPSGKGRTYTVIATATDLAGNSTVTTGTCVVPK